MNKRIIPHIRAYRLVWMVLLALFLPSCQLAETPPDAVQPGAASTPAPTATPPLSAAQLLARARAAHALGDYEHSAQDFSDLLATHPTAPEARAARYYIAESYAQRGRWTSAVESFKTFLADPVQDDLSARALFWLARGYEQAGDWNSAVASYERYRALKTPIEPYAAVRQAAQLDAYEQDDGAAQLYEYVASTDIDRGERAGSYEKAIALRRKLGQNDAALALYGQLLGLADQPNYRARILTEGAALARDLQQPDQARAWLLESIERAPNTGEAADAVELLLQDPAAQLSPATAARVLFAAERYDAALPLFDAAIGAATGDDALELRRLRALTLRGQQNLQGALNELAAIGAESPNSVPGRQAQLDWIQTLGWSGQTEQAITAYRQFAVTYGVAPSADPLAAEALSRVAELLERNNDTAGAAQQRLDLGRRFPTSQQAPSALFSAGWAFYNANQLPQAQEVFQLLADNESANISERARAAYWYATLIQQQGAQDEAIKRWQQAYQLASESYYGTRSADKLTELQIALPNTANPRPLDAPFTVDDWRTAGQWVATTWTLPVSDTLQAIEQIPPDIAQAGSVVRGQALEEVGLHIEAIHEWNDLLATFNDDPLKLLQVARVAHESGVPSTALRATARLEELAPIGTVLPDALLRLLYPVPYPELIRNAAQEQGIDPLLLLALIRRESLFDPGAISSVGAMGLGQIMPGTGQGIAQRLGINDWNTDLLLHPATSVRFAAFYISQQIAGMDGSIHAGLSAYNGGPGNAQRWIETIGLADPDVFTENIDYPETRTYVKSVYAHYDVYRRLYR